MKKRSLTLLSLILSTVILLTSTSSLAAGVVNSTDENVDTVEIIESLYPNVREDSEEQEAQQTDGMALSNNLANELVPEIVGYENAVAKGHVARLKNEEKDLYSAIFQNTDGTNTMYLFSDPIKFIDKDGTVKDKSNKILSSKDGFINGENDIRISFPSSLNNGVNLSYNDINITLKPRVKSNSTARLETDEKAAEKEELVRYDGVFGKNTYLTYKPEYMGFKEDIILKEYTGQSEFEFTLLTSGLELFKETADSEGGSLYLRNGKGEKVASLGQIIIFTADNGNNTFGEYEFETVRENQEYIVTIKVDPDYLKDPKTTYPVTIDPTITINYNNGSGAI